MYVRKWKAINNLFFADDKYLFQRVVLGFRREVDKNCDLVVYYAASSGNFLATFRDNLSAPSSGINNPRTLRMRLKGCTETSVRNYHYPLHNNLEERSSQLVY